MKTGRPRWLKRNENHSHENSRSIIDKKMGKYCFVNLSGAQWKIELDKRDEKNMG